MSARARTVATAKAKLSEGTERAQTRGPQVITRRGREVAAVVSVEQRARKAKRVGTLAEFFAASPLRGSGLWTERRRD